ncbi:MAG: hypothetical protein H0V89_08380 [Deltaproteobacteria bacterium]|nr:hypothetical protein [Deltaproteobacteria bacterium]
MELFLLVVAVVFGVASLAGGIWLLVLAFQESVGWGIGSLLCSPISLIFALLHLPKTWQPLALNLGAGLVAWLAVQAIELNYP